MHLFDVGFSQDHRKFRQRYFEFMDYFRAPDGPVFMIICGEGPCSGIAKDYITVRFLVNQEIFVKKKINCIYDIYLLILGISKEV